MTTPTNNFVTSIIKAVYNGPLEVKGTASQITVKVDNREAVKEMLYASLKKQKYPFEDVKTTKSSFNVTELKTPEGKSVTIIYKNAKGGGGSGAGAEVTELAESAQCWYTAVAFNGKIESQDDFLKSYKKIAKSCFTDASIEKIMAELPDDWVQSSIMIANHMKSMPIFKSNLKTYQFHRGSSVVDKINSMFLSANRDDPMFANINKWSPADIWLMTPKGRLEIEKADVKQSFGSLNSLILNLYSSADLVGVSLKKVGKTVNDELFNFSVNKYLPEFKSFKITDKSKDGYILFAYKQDPNMSIQFRSFTDTGSWQGEIKGKYASGGKIGGGQVAAIIKRIAKKDISAKSAKDITARALKNDPKLVDEIIKYAKDIGLKLDANIAMQKSDWRYSKYLTTEMFSVFKSLTKTQQQRVLSEIIGYSASATENSGVFIKIS